MVFFIEAEKQPEAFVVCGSVQSVALHLDSFKDMQMLRLILGEYAMRSWRLIIGG